jgi:hypothetical protein
MHARERGHPWIKTKQKEFSKKTKKTCFVLKSFIPILEGFIATQFKV